VINPDYPNWRISIPSISIVQWSVVFHRLSDLVCHPHVAGPGRLFTAWLRVRIEDHNPFGNCVDPSAPKPFFWPRYLTKMLDPVSHFFKFSLRCELGPQNTRLVLLEDAQPSDFFLNAPLSEARTNEALSPERCIPSPDNYSLRGGWRLFF